MSLTPCSRQLLESRPFALYNWEQPRFPVLISVPHAGRFYPHDVLTNVAIPHGQLQRLEDRLVDRLVQSCIDAGFSTIIARVPRFLIDLNRDCREIDRTQVFDLPSGFVREHSAKLRAGLGLIPARLHPYGPIWRDRLSWTEVARRIALVHQPYHAKIARQMQLLRRRFGGAVLIDVHSMPSLAPTGAVPPPDLVIGSLHGRSAEAATIAAVLAAAQAHRLMAVRDAPYPGGYILAQHGRPEQQMHAVQLEIDRALYLADNGSSLRSDAAALLAEFLRDLALTLSQRIAAPKLEAAE
jgi:N-formylglutamate amidohydrolase